MCKFCWIVSLLLAVALAAMAYLFVIRGNVTPASDGRTAIVLEPGERDFVLAEMRVFLESLQAITEALAKNDVKAAGDAARKVGMAVAHSVPASLMGKLPLEFKTLGMSTHKAFDDLALEADTMGDGNVLLGKVATLMTNCTTCHGGYRIDPAMPVGQ